MGASAVDTLARLRVCRDAACQVPPDLVIDAIAVIERSLHTETLRARRDELIRRAALLLPDTEARPYTRAGMLLQEARAMNRTWHILRAQPPQLDQCTPRACLHAARLCAPLPESQRHFYRVLASGLT